MINRVQFHKKVMVLVVIMILLFSQLVDAQKTNNNQKLVYPYHRVLTSGLLTGYQKLISPSNQASCPMYPTDSGYAKEAFKRYNPVIALLKTSDRLLRCGNDVGNYNTVNLNGMTRYADPVDYSSTDEKIILSYNYKDEFNMDRIKNYDNINADLLYQFAKKLEVDKKYERALIEYERLLSYYPESVYRANTLKSIFNILYKQEKYIEAISLGKRILSSKDKKLVNITEFDFFIGAAYFRIANFRLARDYFNQVEVKDKGILRDKAYLLDGLSFAQEEKWEEAKLKFKKINSTSKLYKVAQKSVALASEGRHLKYKNPKIAGVLGIVPGLGYLYSGYKSTALSSLLVNSLFMLSTKQAFDNDNESLGTLVGIFGASFYAGNIYGSIETAKRTNKKIKKDHLLKFKFYFGY
ncbi:membrane protein insertion efficiency factor YidD [Orenia marismortui]|uniref:Hemolytic domain-containing protein n=1 Tax=Orenia marismortui TaxID=46469 RepID=A0A4V3GYC3_9FIRM|nr:membrane protein insertion efficiency factor YidD [Orenia marismortui]TDX51813.1 hemolytic domain-containing protein [Orenia marismortui]